MAPQHLIFLFVIMVMAVSIFTGLTVLVRSAFKTAQLRHEPAKISTVDGFIRWNEADAVTLFGQKTLSHINRIVSGKIFSRRAMDEVLPLIDPVDGTAFEEGEPIIRCACGTNYHQHSWQWLSEKMNAKCVNCKRPTASQEALA
ncbi:MAG: hypothetical protein DMG65_00355 [Candidatus Angelobacter sp. Gp1-AA117]|nr:MAG: hypothetical protein DMG65_00355 [Candidatus Angelobacter sp. Gp1-AA117]